MKALHLSRNVVRGYLRLNFGKLKYGVDVEDVTFKFTSPIMNKKSGPRLHRKYVLHLCRFAMD